MLKGRLCYKSKGDYYWVALFADADIDKLLEEKKCKNEYMKDNALLNHN